MGVHVCAFVRYVERARGRETGCSRWSDSYPWQPIPSVDSPSLSLSLSLSLCSRLCSSRLLDHQPCAFSLIIFLLLSPTSFPSFSLSFSLAFCARRRALRVLPLFLSRPSSMPALQFSLFFYLLCLFSVPVSLLARVFWENTMRIFTLGILSVYRTLFAFTFFTTLYVTLFYRRKSFYDSIFHLTTFTYSNGNMVITFVCGFVVQFFNMNLIKLFVLD